MAAIQRAVMSAFTRFLSESPEASIRLIDSELRGASRPSIAAESAAMPRSSDPGREVGPMAPRSPLARAAPMRLASPSA